MTLSACRECGAQVSSQAKNCPHCGVRSPTKKPMKLVDWIVGLAGCALIGWLVLQTPWGKSVVADFIKGFRADQEQSR